MRNNEKGLSNVGLTMLVAVFVSLWAWVNREQIIPAKPISLNDTELVKLGAFPGNGVTPIGTAYGAISSNASWSEYSSKRGVKLVEVSGSIGDADLAKRISEQLFNAEKVCEKIASVSRLMRGECSGPGLTGFHKVAFRMDDYPEANAVPGFKEAAQEYRAQYRAHMGSTIKYKTQFLLKVDRSQTSILRAEPPYVVGYSGITFSAGPFTGEEIKFNELSQLVERE